MTNSEEILIEQYFPYMNMEKEQRDFYINLLLNSKEVTDSEFNLNSYSSPQYDLVFISLKNDGKLIRFDGAISNGEENKLIEGAIIRRGNKYFVFSNLFRLFELVHDDKKEYDVIDEFRFKDGGVLRKTTYSDKRYFESTVTLKSSDELEEYYRKKIGMTKER
jgi:hypothetical protein